jgi:hypothetical protein
VVFTLVAAVCELSVEFPTPQEWYYGLVAEYVLVWYQYVGWVVGGDVVFASV